MLADGAVHLTWHAMTSTPETRYSLLGKLRNSQDAEAWTEFASIYQPLILRVAIRRGLQHADAIDVTQEVLTRVAAAIDSFQVGPNANFRGWLYRLTRNLVIDFLRRRRHSPLVQCDAPLEGLADPDADESLEFQMEFQRQVLRMAAKEVRRQVQPRTWQAFWRTEIEREPVEQVARELDLSPGAVYVARSRMLARLRKCSEARWAATQELEQ